MGSSALKRVDRGAALFGAAILGLAALAWWWQAQEAAAMAAMGEMVMPATDWSGREGLAAAAMWLVMMQAMMLPAALPAFLLYRRCLAREPARGGRLAAFVAGYAGIWAGFALAMTALQAALEALAVLDRHRLALAAGPAALVLSLAGLYQLTALKGRCQRHCQGPLPYLARHARPGLAGALRLGAGHGLYCLGCCWALMGLLLVAGAMDLLAMAGLSAVVLAEKVLPLGRYWRSLSGAGLLLAGLALALA